MYPTIKDNLDYTSIINKNHFERIREYIEDARQQGAKIIEINPAGEDLSEQKYYRIPPTLVIEPSDNAMLMQNEIFGPLLPVKTYSSIDEVLNYLNKHPHPLALYYFGRDKSELKKVLNGSISGGVTINDVIMHAAQDDLPFGGIGQSGMGAYHGKHGFKTFSNARAIYTQSALVAKLAATMRPPYKKAT